MVALNRGFRGTPAERLYSGVLGSPLWGEGVAGDSAGRGREVAGNRRQVAEYELNRYLAMP
jgi:hypothetical protein